LYQLAKPYKVRVSTSPDTISREFALEANENIGTVELGVQSMSEKVLSMNKRNYKPSEVTEAFDRLCCDTVAQFMTGMYGEDETEFLESCRQLNRLKTKYARIYPTLVFKDTPLSQLKFKPLLPAESVLRTAWLYIELVFLGVKVIRVALPAGESVGGFAHPAFHDIIKSIILYALSDDSDISYEPASVYHEYRGYKGILNGKAGSVIPIREAALSLKRIYTPQHWLNSKELKTVVDRLLI
jgi:histone acetyltransferase (RNA polymerase elongator complex component)